MKKDHSIGIILLLLYKLCKDSRKYPIIREGLSKYAKKFTSLIESKRASFGIILHWGVYSVPGYDDIKSAYSDLDKYKQTGDKTYYDSAVGKTNALASQITDSDGKIVIDKETTTAQKIKMLQEEGKVAQEMLSKEIAKTKESQNSIKESIKDFETKLAGAQETLKKFSALVQ